MLKGKTVVLAVSGSIAAYKIASLASALKKLHANVQVLMTKNAVNFINPITFESLTGNKCLVDTFDRNFQYSVEHVALAKQADVVLVAPASANVIGKIAHGIADDMLTTTVMACKCKKIIAPAMNTNMFDNPILQDNLKILEHYGYEVISPAVGYLACGDTGAGKMPEPELLLQYILREIAYEKDMQGKRVLVTAGPTQESIDPVRFITNHSTGKMGYAIAKMCMLRGAEVTLVSGPTSIAKPEFVHVVDVVTAKEMYEEVTKRAKDQDIIIKAAAVADYRPKSVSSEKMKKKDDDLAIPMERTDDILKFLGEHKKEHQFLCGFSMETENMLENSRKKLEKKHLDMIVANNLKAGGSFTRKNDERGDSLKDPGRNFKSNKLIWRQNKNSVQISIVSRKRMITRRQFMNQTTNKTQTTGSSVRTRHMVQTAIFGVIIVIMAFTPFLGYIPLGFTRATIIHIPVILASLLMGPKTGALLGLLFGLTSFINNTVNPTVTSFVFTPFYSMGEFSGGIGSVIICFVPRILTGVVPHYIYKLVKKCSKSTGVSKIGLILAGVGGSLTNTLLVMNLIYLFFKDTYAAANGVAVKAVYGFILSIIGINGVPEAIVAGVLTALIGRTLMKKNMKERLGFTHGFSD